MSAYPYESEYIDFSSLEDLQQFGIFYLTSESCGYSMRVLFDVNETGEQYLSAFFGGLQFMADTWNHTAGSKHSIMLPHSVCRDIYIFCLLESGQFEMIFSLTRDNQTRLHGFRALDWNKANPELDAIKALGFSIGRLYYGKNRNQHMMSGRTY